MVIVDRLLQEGDGRRGESTGRLQVDVGEARPVEVRAIGEVHARVAGVRIGAARWNSLEEMDDAADVGIRLAGRGQGLEIERVIDVADGRVEVGLREGE